MPDHHFEAADGTPGQRAAVAERSVTALFGGPLFGMPFTHLARPEHPVSRRVVRSWNYWWQAHYLDAIVDAGLRELSAGDVTAARRRARRGDRLLATIRLRNAGRFTNAFYDDMAWLALAVDRLGVLHTALGRARPRRRLRVAEVRLTSQLRSAVTDDLGGGVFWNTTRDFKNVPATGPVALHLARTGRRDEAARLVDWMYARLLGNSGLFLDGIRIERGTERVVSDIYTYNQGTVLGALVTLGDDTSRQRAASLVEAVGVGLTEAGTRVLRTHGGGDGGLFTGILARYLALAAADDAGDDHTRALAAELVRATAEALWVGRTARADDRADTAVFPADPSRPDDRGLVELSTQLQAWMTLEAAAALP